MSRPQVNTSKDGQCGYIAYYNDKQAEVYADTMFKAKERAVAYFNVPKIKQHTVTVILAEKNGEQVTHTADF